MGRSRQFGTIRIMLFQLSVLWIGAYPGNGFCDGVDSREFNLLLDPSSFTVMEDGFQKTWQTVLQVAEARRVRHRPNRNPFDVERQRIVFLDTKNNDLRASGRLLRQRTKYRDGKLRLDWELTLKQRSRNPMLAIARPIECGRGIRPVREFEEDLSVRFGLAGPAIVSVYSQACKVKKLDISMEKTVLGAMEIFPDFRRMGLSMDERLRPVSGLIIEEYKINPGRFDFGGGLIVSCDITCWRIKFDDVPMIAEFSYDHKFRNLESLPGIPVRVSEDFIVALYQAFGRMVIEGQTKTDLVYEGGRKNRSEGKVR